MALLNNREITVRDFLFVAAGILAAAWFFFDYDNQNPMSLADPSLKSQQAAQHAIEMLNNNGYSVTNFDYRTHFNANRELLDSMQAKMGRREMIQQLRADSDGGLYPFYWRIRFAELTDQETDIVLNQQEEEPASSNGPSPDFFEVRLSSEGQWIELANFGRYVPSQRIRRDVLRKVLEQEVDSSRPFLPTVTDSMLSRSLRFDFVRPRQGGRENQDPEAGTLQRLRTQSGYGLAPEEAFRMAEVYLENSGWNLNRFVRDTVFVERFGSINAARVRYMGREHVYGQKVMLTGLVSPTGSLLSMRVRYNPESPGEEGLEGIGDLVRVGVIFLFFIALIIIFFYRIRARVIDTRSALVVSIVGGLLIPVSIILYQLDETLASSVQREMFELIAMALSVGLAGAAGSIAFFLLTSVGESITRQHWPGKLSAYDYLRQGMIFNRPVGVVLVRSVILAFLLAGVWSMLLWVFPGINIDVGHSNGNETSFLFLSQEVYWPALHFITSNAWYSLMTLLGIFMVVGSQVYSMGKRRWMAVLFIVIGFSVVEPITVSASPELQEFLLLGLMGVPLALIYLKWDFLTVLISHFFFIVLLELSSGWMVLESPDTYLFVTFIILLVFVAMGGTLSIFLGEEEQALPSYIPDYVEELAQEERMKQELQIAREVQQSFLPAKTPEIANLDLAGICQPAYETGGDYFDVIPLDDHRIAVTIGDVSGKGIQAAFYMTFIKGVVHSLCREVDSPAELLKKANRLFYSNARRGTFVSLIYGILDLADGSFRFARAGHNPIIYYHSEKQAWEELKPNGLGLGLTPGDQFDNQMCETRLELRKEDILLLYTDGIVEALNGEHQFYGTERLQEILNKNAENTAQIILQSITEHVHDFVGQAKQHDDMTMLVIKYCQD